MIRYYKLFDMLNKMGMKKNDLREIVSGNTVAKLSKGEYVSGEVIDRLCTYFKCQPNDIMEVYKTVSYVDDNGMEQTKEILVNQEMVDLFKEAITNPEVWKMYEAFLPAEQLNKLREQIEETLK